MFILFVLLCLGGQASVLAQGPVEQPLHAPHGAHPHEAMQKLEDERMASVLRKYRGKNISVEVFYHVSAWQPYWKEVVLEQLHLLAGRQLVRGHARGTAVWMYAPKKSAIGVASIAHKVNIVLHGDDEQVAAMRLAISSSSVDFLHKITYSHSPSIERGLWRASSLDDRVVIRTKAEKVGATTGEFATIDKLFQHCKKRVSEGSNSVVLYLHNKGGCCRKGEAPQADWRDMMNAINIEFASVCLRALEEGYSACGADYQDMHYSGNFWWASCNHIAFLPGLWDPIDNAWEAEFFLFNISEVWEERDPFGEECAYRPFHCKIDHYHTLCPRMKYMSAVQPLLQSDEMPFLGFNGNKEPSAEAPKRVWNSEPCLSAQSSREQLSKTVPYYNRPKFGR